MSHARVELKAKKQKIQNIRLGQGNMESGGLDDETD
jgi:hypothetical protein